MQKIQVFKGNNVIRLRITRDAQQLEIDLSEEAAADFSIKLEEAFEAFASDEDEED